MAFSAARLKLVDLARILAGVVKMRCSCGGYMNRCS
jgi:hypothetical protein